MGQAWSLVTKPLRNFNVESRAHKIVSKKQPAPAPKYSATIADIQRIKEGIQIAKIHFMVLEGLNFPPYYQTIGVNTSDAVLTPELSL